MQKNPEARIKHRIKGSIIFHHNYIATFILLMCSLGCSKNKANHDDQMPNIVDFAVRDSMSDTLNEMEIKVIEAVLNLPDVLKFSKTQHMIEKYKQLYVKIDGRIIEDNSFVINQQNHILILLDKSDTIDYSKKPCYVFTKINIEKNTAYVQMFFEMTGTLAYGKMLYKNDQWVPDKTFLIGRM